MNQIQPKGIMILIIVEIFWLTIGTMIHETVHSFSFYLLSGKFGQIHILDSVAYSYRTIAVCIPPQGLVILDATPFELIAYGTMFLVSFLFAFFLFKWFYSDSNAKKSEMSPIH